MYTHAYAYDIPLLFVFPFRLILFRLILFRLFPFRLTPSCLYAITSILPFLPSFLPFFLLSSFLSVVLMQPSPLGKSKPTVIEDHPILDEKTAEVALLSFRPSSHFLPSFVVSPPPSFRLLPSVHTHMYTASHCRPAWQFLQRNDAEQLQSFVTP